MEENILSSPTICLICCSTVIPTTPQPPCHQSSKKLLSNQLNIIFILRNLLQVPIEKLENYLKIFGNPDDWQITICDQCTSLTNNGIELNYKLAVITRQIKAIQLQVLGKIKISQKIIANDRIDDKDNKAVRTIFQEVRSFVKDNQETIILDDKLDSFLDGDRLADELYQKTKTCLVDDPIPKNIKEELEDNQFDNDKHSDDDHDWQPNSPSPPPTPPTKPPKKSVKPKISPKSRVNPKSRSFPIDKFICNLCPDTQKCTFRHASKWREHLVNHHDTKTITCPEVICKGLSFDKLEDYLTHRQKTHLFKMKRKCEYCDKEFKCLPTYYSHRTLKHGDKVEKGKGWICDYCGKGLGTLTSLKCHLKYKHNRDINGKTISLSKYICEVCGLELKSEQGVKAHYRVVHKREFVATCHLCGKELKNKFNLKQHLIRKHKEEAREELEGMKVGGKTSELWRCRVAGCPRYYFEKGKLDKHRLEAHGLKGEEEGKGELKERPWKCDKCGQGFWMRNKLKEHERIHEKKGRVDWVCGECGKGFGMKKYLRDHIVRQHKVSREELNRREKEGKLVE